MGIVEFQDSVRITMLRGTAVLLALAQVITGYVIRSSDQGWDETKISWEDWDPELANEITAGGSSSSGKGEIGMTYPKRSPWPNVGPSTWPDWLEGLKDCLGEDGFIDPTKCPYKRSSSTSHKSEIGTTYPKRSTWPNVGGVWPEGARDCFDEEGRLDPAKCPYKRSSSTSHKGEIGTTYPKRSSAKSEIGTTYPKH